MPDVRLVIDIVVPNDEPRRAEKIATMPGVPSPGEYVDTVPGPTLALMVKGVRWSAIDGTVNVWLGSENRPGIVDHGLDGLELADHFVKDLAESGWSIED